MRWSLVLLCGALLVSAGCAQNANIQALQAEKQQLQETIVKQELEIRDLQKQIEIGDPDSQKRIADLETRLSAKQRQLDLLKAGIQDLRGQVKLSQKVEYQLRSLARELGGTVVDNRVQLQGDLFFAPGQYQLRPEAKSVVKRLTQILMQENEKLTLMVAGHTDSDPIRASRRLGIRSNRHLSLMRSLSVLNEMVEDGYPAQKLYCTGWGDLFPVLPNSSKENKARNRRVELYIDPAMSGIMSSTVIMGVQPDTTSSSGTFEVVEEGGVVITE